MICPLALLGLLCICDFLRCSWPGRLIYVNIETFVVYFVSRDLHVWWFFHMDASECHTNMFCVPVLHAGCCSTVIHCVYLDSKCNAILVWYYVILRILYVCCFQFFNPWKKTIQMWIVKYYFFLQYTLLGMKFVFLDIDCHMPDASEKLTFLKLR